MLNISFKELKSFNFYLTISHFLNINEMETNALYQ